MFLRRASLSRERIRSLERGWNGTINCRGDIMNQADVALHTAACWQKSSGICTPELITNQSNIQCIKPGIRRRVLHLGNSTDPYQSCPWVHFVWPNPTQPTTSGKIWTQPDTTNNGAYSSVVTCFYTQSLCRTFCQRSILPHVLYCHYTYEKRWHYVIQKQAVQRNV